MCFSAEKSAVLDWGSSQRNNITAGTRSAVSTRCSTIVLSKRLGHDLAHDDQRRAFLHAPDRPPGSAEMKHRHRDQRAAPLPQFRHFERQAQAGIEHVPARQHGAFRQAGRARRAELRGDRAVLVAAGILAAARQFVERQGPDPAAAPLLLNSGPVTTSVGLTSSMMSFTSLAVSRQLIGAATAPALSSAKMSSR